MKKGILLLMMISLLLNGCWSRKELTELGIVSAMAIDKVNDEYLLTVQVVNPGDIAGKTLTTRVAISTYESKGKSVFEAIRKLSKESPRRLYFAHLRIVVIGEELAREGISKSLDLMSRDHEFRTDFYIVVAKEHTAFQIVNVLTPIEKNPSSKIFNSIEVAERIWAPTVGVKLDEIINNLTSKGINPVLTSILISGDLETGGDLENVEEVPSPATLKLGNLAIFKEDKLVGWFNQETSKGYNYLTDNVNGTVAVLDYKEGNVTLEFINSITNINVVTKNGTPKIIVDVYSEAHIGEVQAEVDLLKEENIKELEEIVNKRGEKVLTEAIKKAQELQTDVFGFGEAIHRKDPKLWKKLEKNWHDEGFPQLDFQINFQATIRRLGTKNESYLNEMGGGQ